MSPKVQLFLAGSLVALFSFIFVFLISGGVAKLQRMHRASLVEEQNQQYLLVKQKEEAKKKAEAQAAQSVLTPLIVDDASSISNGQVSPAASSQVQTTTSQAAKTSTQTIPVDTVTVEQLVQKYQNVLDLNADPEWKNYPVDLRRHAYAIMSQKRSEQTISIQPTESQAVVETQQTKTPSTLPAQTSPKHTGIDSIFIDAAGAVKK